VTALLKNEEPRVGEGRGQPPRAFQRHDAIVTTAHDEDGKLHPGEIQRRAGSAGHAGGESAKNARRKGSAPEVREFPEYAVYDSIRDVPEDLRNDASLAIDCFMPEREGDMYAIRHWVFCGDQGHCNRFISPEMIIKGGNVLRKEPCAVPDKLHDLRKAMGFDYGKFDFVMHGDDVFLLDANKTPGSPPLISADDQATLSRLVDGFETLMFRRNKESLHG
jgi:hypothetical protein